MKLLSIARTSTFMIHIHVWIGLLFYIFAITSMVLQRKQKKKMMIKNTYGGRDESAL